MDKKAKGASGSNRSNMTGDIVSRRILRDPEPESDRDQAEQSERLEVLESSSAAEKAELLPHKMWVIALAGLFIWIIIAIAALLFFF